MLRLLLERCIGLARDEEGWEGCSGMWEQGMRADGQVAERGIVAEEAYVAEPGIPINSSSDSELEQGTQLLYLNWSGCGDAFISSAASRHSHITTN